MTAFTWACRQHTFHLGRKPLILGIVNVTPDSFSDGGQHAGTDAAIRHAMKLAEDGADLLDIGGESTRPGATPVTESEELARVLPIVKELVRLSRVPLSIDTMKASVAKACLDAGAAIINDVSGFQHDPAMAKVAAEAVAGAIIMHMQGTPQTMQKNPHYGDVVKEVKEFFAERLASLTAAGIPTERIAFDPGIGFGKTQDHNMRLLARLKELDIGRPICLGVSRKGMLGIVTGRERHERDPATLAISCFATAQGSAQILRVHDVRGTSDAVKLWAAIQIDVTG
jgi:dihydropteroate synthase